jgi:hypothetical protein
MLQEYPVRYVKNYNFMIVPRCILLRMRNVADKIYRKNQNTPFLSNNFSPQKMCSLWNDV